MSDIFVRHLFKDANEIVRDANASLKIGKSISSKGVVTLTDVVRAKISATNALRLASTLVWMSEAGKHGISFQFTEWALTEPLVDYAEFLRAEADK
jgi:hypothetical protein